MQHQLLVNKNDLADVRWQESPLPEAQAENDVVLEIEEFALTANNITYAVAGTSMNYWQFFPTDEGWGRVPVWGFGHVIKSKHPDIKVGQRFYGYYPVGTHLLINAQRLSEQGVFDGAPHRDGLAAVYNQYTFAEAPDPVRDATEMLFKPLYTTSFLLADFVDSAQFFGAEDIILTSASSKTSIGLAFLLKQMDQCRVIGLTSATNVEFVQDLGYYDATVTYDNVASLNANRAAVIIDMAGNGSTLAAVHNHYGQQLKYSCLVGATHWDARQGAQEMAGPKPELFFAPSHFQKRSKELAPGEFLARSTAAWDAFVTASQQWMNIEHLTGAAAVQAYYQQLLANRVSPSTGAVLSV